MSLTIGIDPRIRARRIAVRRAEGRRRLRALVVVLVLLAVLVGAWGLTRSPVLDLDHVHVDGIDGARRAEVAEASGLVNGTPLLDVDTGEVAAAVIALPWVAEVAVTRDWPGTVRLDVAARVPLATLASAGSGPVSIDAEGVVLGPATAGGSVPAIDLTTDVAPGEAEPQAGPALAVAAALPADLRPWVDAITVEPEPDADGRALVGLDLVGEATVVLGSTDLLDDKLAAVRAVLDGADLSCLRVIDVIVADYATIRRDPACEGTSPPADPDDS